ncbi:MAG TPA: 2-hydroxychromene-2-carboxylate isomerase [bacterium]|nr:2-hydroxychromene-2-carboxylate isomerase [bacterium]
MVIDYFLALSSPYTYMGHQRFEALAARYGAMVNHKPAQMAKVFAVSGGLPVKQRPVQRQAYRFQELRRWSEYLGLPLNLEPRHFPVDDSAAARLVIAARQRGEAPGRIIGACLRAVWAEERDLADAETLRTIARDAGYDADALLAAAADPAVQAEYDANTAEAIERQVFGAPTYAIGEELFWGQDRLEFVERKLQRG